MGFWENRKIRKAEKQAKRDARWEPFVNKREAVIESASGKIAELESNYRFYTIAILVMAVVGFFWTQVMEPVALVGSIAMRKHWNAAVGTEEDSGFGFKVWRTLPLVTFPIAFAGTVYFLYCLATGQAV